MIPRLYPSDMNRELHTILWYIRADFIMIRRQCQSLSNQNLVHTKKNVPEQNVNREVDDILHGIITTLDDMFESEIMIWNSILLQNLIQAFTSHIHNLDKCQHAAEGLGSTSLSLDNNYIRAKCHIDTTLSILRYNIVSICSSVSLNKNRQSLASVPLHKREISTQFTNTDPQILSRMSARSVFISKPIRHSSLGNMIRRTSSNLGTKQLISSQSAKEMHTKETKTDDVSSNEAIKNTIHVHNRRRLKMCSKELIKEHDKTHSAILNSMASDRHGVSVSYNSAIDSSQQRRPSCRL